MGRWRLPTRRRTLDLGSQTELETLNTRAWSPTRQTREPCWPVRCAWVLRQNKDRSTCRCAAIVEHRARVPPDCTRDTTCPDIASEQTHDDCERLNEEDGEENVLWSRRRGNGPRRAPSIADNEGRYAGGQDGPGTEDRGSDGGGERRARLTGSVPLGRRAAAVGLGLREHALGSGSLRIAVAHRASAPVKAARHASFRRRQPTGAHGRIPSEEARRQEDR